MNSNIKIIPNPAKDYFLLRTTGSKVKTLKVAFLTPDGDLVKEYGSVRGQNAGTYLIDIRNMLSGPYFLKIQYNNGTMVEKLIVL